MDDSPSGNNGGLLIRVSIPMMCLSGITVIMRFVARRLAHQPVLWDDWLVLVALPAAWGVVIAEILAVKFGGYGQHLAYVLGDLENFLKCVYAVTLLYTTALGLTKYSIILFYRRIFRISAVKIPLYVLGGFLTSFLVSAVIVCIVPCIPVYGFWDKTIPSMCYNEVKYFWIVSIPNIISDFLIFIFPIPLVWNLQLRVSQKVAVTSILAIGGFIMIISAVRTVSLYAAQYDADVTWTLLPAGIWNAVECNVAVTLACLPNMGPLLRLALGERPSILRHGPGNSKQSTNLRYKWFVGPNTTGDKRNSFARMKDVEPPVTFVQTCVRSDTIPIPEIELPELELPEIECPQPTLSINVSSKIQ